MVLSPPKVVNLPEISFVLSYTPQSKTNFEPINNLVTMFAVIQMVMLYAFQVIMLNLQLTLIHTHEYIFQKHYLDFNLANLFSKISGRLVVQRNANFKIVFLNRFVYGFESCFFKEKINLKNEYTNGVCIKKILEQCKSQVKKCCRICRDGQFDQYRCLC